MFATDLAALASLITSIAVLISILLTHRKVAQVAQEVATVNGISAGGLLERAEGRRIAELPVDDRTPSEQNYVENLEAGGRDL